MTPAAVARLGSSAAERDDLILFIILCHNKVTKVSDAGVRCRGPIRPANHPSTRANRRGRKPRHGGFRLGKRQRSAQHRRGVEAPTFSHAPLAKDRLKVESFADLYSGDYSPSAIASGPKNSLWMTDEIDQDFGENAIARIATNGKALNTFYYDGVATEGSSLLDIVSAPDGALLMEE
jgi:hypothetical protein